jgi:hypothetical protein
MSQIGDFMVVLTPCGSFFGAARFWFEFTNSHVTLAHQGLESQAGFLRPVLRAEAMRRDHARAHSVWQNMQPDTQPRAAVLPLALSMRR